MGCPCCKSKIDRKSTDESKGINIVYECGSYEYPYVNGSFRQRGNCVAFVWLLNNPNKEIPEYYVSYRADRVYMFYYLNGELRTSYHSIIYYCGEPQIDETVGKLRMGRNEQIKIHGR